MTREEFEKIRPLSKEEYEKHRIKQTILEMQSQKYINARIPKDIKVPDDFINELKDYSNRLIGYSQECEGTFKIKNGEIVDIQLTRIALMPKFRDKERGNNDNN